VIRQPAAQTTQRARGNGHRAYTSRPQAAPAELTRKLLLTTPFESWHGLFAQQPFTGPLTTGLAVSAGCALICLTGAYLTMRRRDITGG
jgi:hypothetical protein